jgi:Host cell surface-exposed lipoprotein
MSELVPSGSDLPAPDPVPSRSAPAVPPMKRLFVLFVLLASLVASGSASAAAKLTPAQEQAVLSAKSYLSMGSGFSRAGLIKQLSSSYGEGFSRSLAIFAVNYLHPNWNQQAVLSAKNYLSMGSGFSRAGLIQQLSSPYGEGFTYAQAVYAANRVGL